MSMQTAQEFARLENEYAQTLYNRWEKEHTEPDGEEITCKCWQCGRAIHGNEKAYIKPDGAECKACVEDVVREYMKAYMEASKANIERVMGCERISV